LQAIRAAIFANRVNDDRIPGDPKPQLSLSSDGIGRRQHPDWRSAGELITRYAYASALEQQLSRVTFTIMKPSSIAAAALAAAVLATALPAFADDWHDRDNRHAQYHQAPPHRYAYEHRYHQGQIWRGHHLAYRNGYWGYYAPRNGARIFISIPI
jgi:hypothetical protein